MIYPFAVRCAGIVAGLGPPATVVFYKKLLAEFERHKVAARLVMSHEIGRAHV